MPAKPPQRRTFIAARASDSAGLVIHRLLSSYDQKLVLVSALARRCSALGRPENILEPVADGISQAGHHTT